MTNYSDITAPPPVDRNIGATKGRAKTARTLKDSFGDSIEYVAYRQEKDEELLKFLVLFFLTSTASVHTDAIISYEL